MSEKASIYAAFVKAQKEFAPALKTANNPHFGKKYADLAACVEAVIDALNNHGIALIQRPIHDDMGAAVETMFVHESGEEMNGGTMHVPASKRDAQGYGSAMTYARRYGLMAACGIAPEDDDGNAATAKPPAPASRQQSRPTAKQPASLPVTDAAAIASHLSTLEACTTLDGLKNAFGSAWTATRSPAVKATYDKLKAIMEATQ